MPKTIKKYRKGPQEKLWQPTIQTERGTEKMSDLVKRVKQEYVDKDNLAHSIAMIIQTMLPDYVFMPLEEYQEAIDATFRDGVSGDFRSACNRIP